MLDLNNTACIKCNLCKTRKNVVNGEGPLDAKIVLIGEGPGQKEDLVGKPFFSQAGVELNKMLEKAGIDRASVYVTNTVRCIPKAPPTKKTGGVRPPTEEEISACKPYLEAELQHIKPNVIVPMGNIALKALLESKAPSITKYRGRELWSEKYNCKIMPVFHPAAILRQLQNEGITIEDFTRIKLSSKTRELTTRKEGNYITINTKELLDEFIERLSVQKKFAFDIETTGLNWQKDQVICISFTWAEGTGAIIPLIKYIPKEEPYTEIKKRKVKKKVDGVVTIVIKETPVAKTRIIDRYEPYWGENQKYVLDALKEILANDADKSAHNGKFDIKFLTRIGITVNNFTFDTMLAHYLLDENAIGRHGLKDCAVSYTDLGSYDDDINDWFKERKIPDKKKNYAHLPEEMRNKYAGKDTDCTFRLENIFGEQLEKEGLLDFFNRLIMPLSNTLMGGELNGISIDVKYLQQLKKELSDELTGLLKDLYTKANKTSEFNFNSTKQLRELFFGELKYPIVKMTKGGKSGKQNPATDEETLKAWTERGYDIPKLLLKYRKAFKLLHTYVEGIEEVLDENNRIHTTYLIHGTVTGRLSSRQPNLQNIPRDDKRIKRLFISRPGWVLVEADYAQAEFRHWANYAQDEKMIADIVAATNGTGPDVHILTASEVNHIPIEQVTKDLRQKAKTTVFGLMYGRSAKSLAEEYGFSEEEANTIVAHFFGKYPKALAWLDATVKTAKVYGQVRNIFGRLRRLPTIKSPDSWLASEAERQAKNSPIQSAASDMTCNAANRIKIRFKNDGLKGLFCLQVHDSLTYEIPLNELQRSLNIIKEEMERATQGVTVPMVAEFKVGDRMGVSPEWVKKKDDWYKILKKDDQKVEELITFDKELATV